MKTYKVLYANGCSFSSGFELGNDQFEYDFDIDQITPEKSPSLFKVEHLDYIHNNAYPAHLSKFLNIPLLINKSIPGASNELIVHNTILDLMELKKNYDINDIFVSIGLTEQARYLLYSFETNNYENHFLNALKLLDENNKDEIYNPITLKKVLENIQHATPFLQYLNKIYKENPMHLTISYFKTVLDLSNFLKVNGFNYFIHSNLNHNVRMFYPTKYVLQKNQNFKELDVLKLYHELIEQDENVHILPKNIKFEDIFNDVMTWPTFINICFKNKLKLCKYGHPDAYAHKIWAGYLYAKITR